MAENNPSPAHPSRARNLGIAGIAGLTGCVTLIIVFGALLLGLWLDSLMGQRGPATICTVVLSVPLSLYVMVKLALGLVKGITPPRPLDEQNLYASVEKED